jgi:hypothetical protein
MYVEFMTFNNIRSQPQGRVFALVDKDFTSDIAHLCEGLILKQTRPYPDAEGLAYFRFLIGYRLSTGRKSDTALVNALACRVSTWPVPESSSSLLRTAW